MKIYESLAAVSDYAKATPENVQDVRRLALAANVIAMFLVPLLCVTVPATVLVLKWQRTSGVGWLIVNAAVSFVCVLTAAALLVVLSTTAEARGEILVAFIALLVAYAVSHVLFVVFSDRMLARVKKDLPDRAAAQRPQDNYGELSKRPATPTYEQLSLAPAYDVVPAQTMQTLV